MGNGGDEELWPSFAVATLVVPTTEPAPETFSTITRCGNLLDSASASSRAATSVVRRQRRERRGAAWLRAMIALARQRMPGRTARKGPSSEKSGGSFDLSFQQFDMAGEPALIAAERDGHLRRPAHRFALVYGHPGAGCHARLAQAGCKGRRRDTRRRIFRVSGRSGKLPCGKLPRRAVDDRKRIESG